MTRLAAAILIALFALGVQLVPREALAEKALCRCAPVRRTVLLSFS